MPERVALDTGAGRGARSPAAGGTGAGRFRALLGPALAGAVAVASLLVHAPAFWPLEPHVGAMNDQVGYITTARWLADTGELRSHTVIPAFAAFPDGRLYMPGHYCVLALSFVAFGVSPLTWRLPSLLSYVISSALVFALGRRLYGAAAGAIAAGMFVVFPPNVILAFTAMSEPTFVAAALIALWVLALLPERFRAAAVPLLVPGPFLFREHGALLVLPMSALVWTWASRRRAATVLIPCLGSALTLLATYSWQRAAGKLALPISWLQPGRPNFGDALLDREHADASLAQWLEAMGGNLLNNAAILERQLTLDLVGSWPAASVAIMLALLALCLLRGLLGLRRAVPDFYALAVGVMGAAALLAVAVLHVTVQAVTYRHMLFAFPLASLPAAATAHAALGRLSRSFPWPRVGYAAAASALVLPLAWISRRANERAARAAATPQLERMTQALERIGHDDRTLLVSPPNVGLDYALRHYPVRWSFVPANDATLRLMGEHFVVGTAVIAAEDLDRGLSRAALQALGLVQVAMVGKEGQIEAGYVVFSRRP